MKIDGFQDLYIAELQEARSFEEMLTRALAKMADLASTDRLKTAFKEHQDETRSQLERVEALLKKHGADRNGHADQSMQSLIGEADRMAGMMAKGPLRDVALIASAQRVEHYEMAVYGTLATYAEALGHSDDTQILSAILQEEEDADDLLSDLAEGVVNPSALEATVG